MHCRLLNDIGRRVVRHVMGDAFLPLADVVTHGHRSWN
jgi:hypothetical protein